MKNKFSISILILASFTALVSCSSKEKEVDSKELAEERNDAKFSAEEKSVADFMVDVADITLCEIKISSSAAEKSKLSFTKDYAVKMIENHKKMYEDIKQMAAKKSITLPENLSEEATEVYSNLVKNDRDKFDEEYCLQMIDSHKETISKFEKAAKDSSDLEIQAWAQNLLPQLRIELDAAYACEDAHKK